MTTQQMESSSLRRQHVSGGGVVGHDRIRRNTACTSCRDSKVKCNASATPNEPCLRCSKLQIPCVVDKSHKRSTRRSKLEQIERELQNIRDAVATKNQITEASPGTVTSQSPSTVFTQFARRPSEGVSGSSLQKPLSSASSLTHVPVISPPASMPPQSSSSTPALPIRQPATEARALGSRVFSAEDIDYYFDRYFEHFHPLFPILRHRDPDKCYQSGPFLFWIIIYIACRRYAKDRPVFEFLTETIPREVWPAMAMMPIPHSYINALILLCVWPLPMIRFLLDETPSYMSVTINACLLQGYHTGNGAHTEYCYGPRHVELSDEDVTFSWVGCSIAAQRVSAANGCISFCPLFDEAMPKDNRVPVGGYLDTLFKAQKFSSRMERVISANLRDGNVIPDSVVRLLEDEFETNPDLMNPETDLDRFTLLATKFEVQITYFISQSATTAQTQQKIYRTFRTAQSVVELALALEDSYRFLTHAPYYVFRWVIDAVCVIFRTILSKNSTILDPTAAEAMVKTSLQALEYFSVEEGDIMSRLTRILDSYWSLRTILPMPEATSRYPHRLGGSMAYEVLRHAKVQLDQLQKARREPHDKLHDVSDGPNGETQQRDYFQDIDWTALMNDFDWVVGEPSFLLP